MTISLTPLEITAECLGTFPLEVNIAGVGQAGTNYNTYVAGEALGGHRAVYIGTDGKAYLASPLDYKALAGITVGAAALGDNVNVQHTGAISMTGWAFTVGLPVFVQANGTLSTTQDVAALYTTVVGVSNSSNSLVVGIQPQIKLGA